ncbi:lysophospholipid acyltransferase family protein [Paenibacillus chartarius]|uniref:Lysophospholipid acyltransferase family protein n=1 Tax=Paenibacillus chartarius TaxID=747481 RepID=A0ABV6DPY3_9BACL
MYDWIGLLTRSERVHRALFRLAGWLPPRLLEAVLASAGRLVYRMLGAKTRSAIETNMRNMLGAEASGYVPGFARTYMANVAVTMYELLIGVYGLPRLRERGRLAGKFGVEGEHRLEEALQAGKGAIVYTPHTGNFFYAYWYLSQRYDCLTVATAQSPELHPIYMKFKELGCRGFDYDITPPIELIRSLRRHVAGGGVVFLLGDFYRPAFPKTEWFGRPTRAPEGAALLGIEQKVPIVPLHASRMKGLRHRLRFGVPLMLHERFGRHERAAATIALNAELERIIRADPTQWFYWFNANERWEEAEGPHDEHAGEQAAEFAG